MTEKISPIAFQAVKASIQLENETSVQEVLHLRDALQEVLEYAQSQVEKPFFGEYSGFRFHSSLLRLLSRSWCNLQGIEYHGDILVAIEHLKAILQVFDEVHDGDRDKVKAICIMISRVANAAKWHSLTSRKRYTSVLKDVMK